MLGFSGYSGAKSAKAAEIEQRLRSIERRLGRGASTGPAESADHLADAVTSALGVMASRFLGSSNSTRILAGANSISDEAGKIAGDAAKLGNDTVRRIAHEIKQRPLATLAVAIGMGVLVGLVGRRR